MNILRGVLSACAATAVWGGAVPAAAEEIKIGIHQYDAEIFGLGSNKGKETSAAVSLDLISNSPEWLAWAQSPRPYIGGLLNLEGDTSFVGAGLLWRASISDLVYLDYGIGLDVHNGTKEVPSPNLLTDAVLIQNLVLREEREIEFGSRVLFRNQFALGYRLGPTWAAEVTWNHVSNGTLFADVNEGADTLGMRFAKRF